jgi:3-hydroxybutyryl-CoA dehydrogenase
MVNSDNRIGIVGEGKMGTNLFYYLLDFGFKLVWICSAGADKEKIRNTFQKKIKRSSENGVITEQHFSFLRDNTVITSDLTDLSGCDLVIEAIPEDLEMKKKLFIEIDRIVLPGCILASNSSSISPSEMIPSESRQDKFAGIHFFYPIALKNIVEVIRTGHTSKKTLDFVKSFLKTIRRRYLLLKEKDSFILNKIFLDFQNEAFLIVRDGAMTYGQMDAIVREYFFPTGVFGFFDSVGLDTMLNAVRNYTRGYPHADYYQPLISKLENLVNEGRNGQRSGAGFYDYQGKEDIEQDSVLKDPAAASLVEGTVMRLNFAYRAAVKRYTIQAKCIPDEINTALMEYFGIDKGPYSTGS